MAVTRIQRLEDGRADPFGRSVEDGFAIIVKGPGGQDIVWADQVFPTEDAANITAARCVPAAIDIRPARRIGHFVWPGGRGRSSTVIVD